MKKAFGFFLIFLGASFVVNALLYLFPGTIPLPNATGVTNLLMSASCMALGIFSIIKGVGLYRKKTDDTTATPLSSDFDNTISFKIKLEFRDYVKSNLVLLSRKYTQVFFYPIIGIVIVVMLPKDQFNSTYLIGGVLYLFLMPLLFYRGFKKNYNSTKSLQEELTYTISKEHIHIKSNTIEVNNSWTNVFSVTETKEFLFIFTSATVANIIPKSCVRSEYDLLILKAIINSYPFPKKLLK